MKAMEEFLSSYNDHGQKLIGKGVEIDCDDGIFSWYELNYLKKYGAFFEALSEGKIKPLNDMQERFVQICKGEEHPFTVYEFAWVKYMNREELAKGKKEMDEYFSRGTT